MGGTGQIGRAAARRLAETGWDVMVGSRGERASVYTDESGRSLDEATGPDGVRAACDWLVEATRGQDWRDVLTSHVRYYDELFDYDAEAKYLQ